MNDDDITIPIPRVDSYERPPPTSMPSQPEPMYPQRPFLWWIGAARWLWRRPRKLPVARARAPWWRRALAWFVDTRIDRYCPRCDEVLCDDSACAGCVLHLALEERSRGADADLHASTVRRVMRRSDPIAMPVPGPGVSSSR